MFRGILPIPLAKLSLSTLMNIFLDEIEIGHYKLIDVIPMIRFEEIKILYSKISIYLLVAFTLTDSPNLKVDT
jgi:hypothetical protein